MTPPYTVFRELTRDSLYQLIAMNDAPLERSSLLAAFGDEDAICEKLEDLLADLAADNKIKTAHNKIYRATRPWADIAYAVVGESARETTRVPIQILNLPPEIDPGVTIPRNDFSRHKLQPGSKIVVRLSRGHNGRTGLRARFIAHADENRPYSLAGTFNAKSGIFTPLDRSIKTDFIMAQGPALKKVPHQFLVQLPRHFDIRDPVILPVEDQSLDHITGEAISQIVIKKHNIAEAHPEKVLQEARAFSRRKISLNQRQDLRSLDFATVDPAGALDLDDAFCAVVEADGYGLYTAIADVPAIVPAGSAVDAEAYRRGLTFYLANNHTTHMLPEVLSTRKSSLIANADRPAIVVKQSLRWDFALKGYNVFAAIIRSQRQLSYGQFYDLLEKDDPGFRTIATIHDGRRRLGINKPLDSLLKSSPDKYATQSIVETLMVQTNSLIAQFLKAAHIPFLSRNFEQTPAGTLNKSGLVQRAYYASYHLGHAQLGLTHYAHTTSPIRRYADIINLRAVHKALGTKGIGISDDEIGRLNDIAAHLNARRDIDRLATHDMQKYHAIPDLMRLQAAPIRVGIYEIGKDYIDILIVQTGLRQRIPATSLPPEKWQIDTRKNELVMLENGKEARRYKQNETLLGQLHNVNPSSALWDITLMPTDHIQRAADTSTPKPA